VPPHRNVLSYSLVWGLFKADKHNQTNQTYQTYILHISYMGQGQDKSLLGSYRCDMMWYWNRLNGSTRHQKLPALSQVGTMVYWAPEMYATCPHCRRIGRLPLYAIKQNHAKPEVSERRRFNDWGQELWLEGGCVGIGDLPPLHGSSPKFECLLHLLHLLQ
jgi:hypothetical protein